jgi:hypothetical protein
MHNSFKIIKTLLCSYSATHVSGTLAPIIMSLLILHIQTPVTVCRWVGCFFQLWCVTTVAFTLLYSYSTLHVSGTLAPIIMSLLILHIQPPVTVCRWVGFFFQLWSVTTVAKAGWAPGPVWRGAVGWGTALQAGRSRIPFPMVPLDFFYNNSSGRAMVLGSTQPLTEMSTRNISWCERRPVRRADNLTTFVCRLSWNLRASTSWNPQGLSRPVMGLLYLYR